MTTSARRGTSPVPITPGPRLTVRTSAVAPISGNAASRPAGGGITPAVLKYALRATEQALASRVAIGADAVELTRTAHETAWKLLQERAPGASLRDRTDAAFAVASMSILRPEELGKLAMVDSGQTRVLAYMKAADKRLDPDRPFVAVDRTVGKGALDPRFADGSDNQVFHTAFFITAGYLSAGRPDKKAQTFLAAFVHETPLDPGVTSGKYAGMPSGGASQQDLRASVYGAMAGARLRELRDAGKGHLNGTILAGMMAHSVDMVPARLPADQHAEAVREILALRRQQVHFTPLVDSPPVRGVVGAGPSPILGLRALFRRVSGAPRAEDR